MQIVTTHKNTDFDALASLVAASLIYPDTTAVLPKSINPNVKSFLSIHKDMFRLSGIDDIDPKDVAKLIIVDTNKWSRLEKMQQQLREKSGLEILVWDHHDPGDSDIEASWTCQEKAGSTITLLIRELKKRKTGISPIQATLFLCGLYEDTGSLTFPSATAEDAYAAAYLLEQGADLSILRTFLQPGYGERQKDLLFEMLKTATRTKVNNYSASINIAWIDGHINNLSLVVHMYREIVNVDVAVGIFVQRENGKCIVIGRSIVEDIDIGSIMRSMGGGGHPGAGSAMLKSANPDSLEEWIVELLKGNQESSVQVRDIMSSPVVHVASDTSMSRVGRILKDRGCTGLPVIDSGTLQGVISRRDFKKLRKSSQLNSPVKAFMSTKNVTISPDRSPMHAARLMVKHDIGRLPVMENNRVIGIISRSDAMRYFYDTLPD
ncbi:MAG: CBS domain-containing protein [Desulfosalsimonas sp.]